MYLYLYTLISKDSVCLQLVVGHYLPVSSPEVCREMQAFLVDSVYASVSCCDVVTSRL